MADINSVLLIGRITRDIDDGGFGYTTGGTARLNISLAVNRRVKVNGAWQDKASFFDVTVWGKTAENIKPYLSKGKQVAVNGFLDQQRWQKDGKNFSKIGIVAEHVQLLGGNTNGSNAPQQSAGNYQYADSGDEFPEEIPF